MDGCTCMGGRVHVQVDVRGGWVDVWVDGGDGRVYVRVDGGWPDGCAGVPGGAWTGSSEKASGTLSWFVCHFSP